MLERGCRYSEVQMGAQRICLGVVTLEVMTPAVGWGAVFPGPRRLMKPRSASRTSFPWGRLGISTASSRRTTEKQRVHCQDRLHFGSREHRSIRAAQTRGLR